MRSACAATAGWARAGASAGSPLPRPAQHAGRGNHRARRPRQAVGRARVTGGGQLDPRDAGGGRGRKQPARFRRRREHRRGAAAAGEAPHPRIAQPAVAPPPRPAARGRGTPSTTSALAPTTMSENSAKASRAARLPAASPGNRQARPGRPVRDSRPRRPQHRHDHDAAHQRRRIEARGQPRGRERRRGLVTAHRADDADPRPRLEPDDHPRRNRPARAPASRPARPPAPDRDPVAGREGRRRGDSGIVTARASPGATVTPPTRTPRAGGSTSIEPTYSVARRSTSFAISARSACNALRSISRKRSTNPPILLRGHLRLAAHEQPVLAVENVHLVPGPEGNVGLRRQEATPDAHVQQRVVREEARGRGGEPHAHRSVFELDGGRREPGRGRNLGRRVAGFDQTLYEGARGAFEHRRT